LLENIQPNSAQRMLSALRVKLLDHGVPPVAYGLLVDVIAVVIVIIVAVVATQLQGVFPAAADLLSQTIP
jgi:Flp pilus assembly pilin Flp